MLKNLFPIVAGIVISSIVFVGIVALLSLSTYGIYLTVFQAGF
jgi:hypothetical protein